MNLNDAILMINVVHQGKDFIEKYPEHDIIINDLSSVDVKRIENEYPGIFDLKTPIENIEFPISAISMICPTIGKKGYPKFKIYVRNDTNEIVRILASE